MFTKENARENQRKGAEAKKRNKSTSAVLSYLLTTKVTDKKQLEAIKKSGLPVGDSPTYREFLVASIMLKTVKKGTVMDLKTIMGITGEQAETINTGNEQEALNRFLDALEDTNAD